MGRGRLAQGPACSPRRWPAGRHVPSPPRASRRGFLASGASRSQRTSQGLCSSWGRSRRCRGRQGELSFPARPRTALERGAPSRAAPRRRRPLQTQAGRPLRPDPGTASVRPSVAPPRAATWQCRPPRPEGRAARSRFRRRDVGPERPSPAPELVPALPAPPWAPITPRTPLSRTRGGGRCAPFATRPHAEVPSTHTLQPRASRPRQPPLGIGVPCQDPSPPRPPHWDGVLAGCRGGGLAGRTPGDCLNGVTRSLPGPSSFCVAYLCLKHIKMT